MVKAKYIFIIMSIAVLVLGCTKSTPSIDDLSFSVIYNKSVDADLIYITPKENSKYLIGQLLLEERSDTLFIEISELTSIYHLIRDEDVFESLSLKREPYINYIMIQNTVYEVEAIRRKIGY